MKSLFLIALVLVALIASVTAADGPHSGQPCKRNGVDVPFTKCKQKCKWIRGIGTCGTGLTCCSILASPID